MIPGLTLKQLAYFDAVVRLGHFGRAPEPDGGFSWERTDLVEPLRGLLG